MKKQVKSITCKISVVEHGHVATWQFVPFKVEDTYGNGMYIHALRLIDDDPNRWDYDTVLDCRYRHFDLEQIIVEYIEDMYGDRVLLVTGTYEYYYCK